MRAAVLTEPGALSVVSVPEPSCGPGDVLIRMRGTGLCGSDLAVHSGRRRPPSLPWVLGHEGTGRIVELGREVSGPRIGQDVVIEPDYCCLMCEPCRAGRTSACEGRAAVGLTVPGLLSDYVAAPAAFVWPVAPRLPLEDLVCVEPATVARAAMRRSGIAPGQSCLVIGAGSQGLLLCQALVGHGVTVFVQEPNEARLDRACSLGATPLPVDVAGLPCLFETSGAPGVVEQGLRRLAKPGTAVLIGMNAAPLGVSPRDLVAGQITLIGSMIYDHPVDFAQTVSALESRTPPRLGAVVSDGYPLDDVQEAFTAAYTASGKVWVDLS
ncbi:zinc-dependent alcohol dehydrogenase [Streptomyces rapamycinicus]|uniref:2-deoxy-scyllo-inosamine dehydrogenase n=1 Tax=Streptomyces rapamycinicus TaxID=1226757 RepID=A0ABR6M1A7_9ACTN|nr:alcohol dehydrogenase catalytic domain-containing protein [Streptomyces rapamycinicus]MBB4788383.1 alcohol dehydrogenase/L-iditol 2-dehydrogenase [Streptomyces rapamycinicus]UTP36016.1 alcohol dehydrogenase catalytic domain-containing protein [Streptomyces rapamycinicus NRRL 5491]